MSSTSGNSKATMGVGDPSGVTPTKVAAKLAEEKAVEEAEAAPQEG